MPIAPPNATYDSKIDLGIGQLPPLEIEPPVLYNELVDIHNALENLTKAVGGPGLINRVVVTSSADLGGVLDSSKEYFLDGIIDMGTDTIIVPATGLSIAGYDFNISGLTSSEDNYTMFTSPVGGSGDLLIKDCLLTTSGTNSQVYDLVDVTGTHAVEVAKINYINCTSLGTLDNYRQGLESGTGRFGGTPELTLDGTWLGGFRISTSIARSIDNAMTGYLFKAGATFDMQTRFLTDINADLGALAGLADFAPANFSGQGQLGLVNVVVGRNGVLDATDTTILPNILPSDLVCDWANNRGIGNTFPGGTLDTTAEATTTITTAGVFVTIAGTFTTIDLQHFDNPANGQLRHLGDTPREYSLYADIAIAGTANKEIVIRIQKYTAATASTATIFSQVRVTNNFAGSRDQAFFNFYPDLVLDKDDYVFLEVANNTDTTNVTAVIGNLYKINVR